ncbi:MAG: hypothetical protein PHC34_01090 [Candidatus Gastranaerophilales bacterium]|nr:hypothetical protein [Candidatus Gastranaerophilales bacterium]
MKRVVLLSILLLLNINTCQAQVVYQGSNGYYILVCDSLNQHCIQKPVSYADPKVTGASTSYAQTTNNIRNTLNNVQSAEYTAQQAIFTAKNVFTKKY